MFEANLSSNLRDHFMKESDLLCSSFDQLKGSLNKLVKVRNELFENLTNIHPLILSSCQWMIENKELGAFLKYSDKHEHSDKFNIYNL